MSGSQVRQVRASSARPAAMRPTSSKNRKLQQKTQFIDTVYGQNNGNQNNANYHSFQKNRLASSKFNGVATEHEDMSRLIPKPDQMYSQKQQLFEQNLHLKQQINKMKQQLYRNRAKMQMLTSKNSKYTKQFNRQFQKKMYWTGNNAYLISGVKAQYEKLKQQLAQRNQQFQILKRQLVQSRSMQYKILAQTLQEENKKLSERIHKMAEVSQQALFDSLDSKSIPQYLYREVQEKYYKMQEKYKESLSQNKDSKQKCKDLEKKIQFLQKLIIQKDNGQYHASKKAKKSQKEKALLQEKIKILQGCRSQQNKNFEVKIEKLKQMEQKRFKAEKGIFDRTLNQKDVRIQKLQKQISYLSTLLTYWKPLDELNRSQAYQQEDNQQQAHQLKKKQQIKNKKNGQSNFIIDSKGSQMQIKTRRLTECQQKGTDFLNNSVVNIQNQSNLRQSQNINNKARVPQTADKRHSEHAQKKRKIDYKQIQHLGQHLKYRFLGLRLKIDDVKKYFDYQKQDSNPQAQFILDKGKQPQDNVWDEQYITMREAKQILKKYPFELQEEQATNLARYLVEQSLSDFVYVDESNEHSRMIVKSIIKSFVGSYSIMESDYQAKIQKQCQDMLDRYHANLLSALSTMASSGFVSRKKFIQLLASLGIEISQDAKDYLVCKMLLNSQSLDKLKYMIILD